MVLAIVFISCCINLLKLANIQMIMTQAFPDKFSLHSSFFFLEAWKLFSWDILSNHWIYLPQFSAIDCTMMVFHFESFIWILGSHGTFNDLCLFITVLAKCWRSKIPDKNWCSGTKDFFRDGCIVQK